MNSGKILVLYKSKYGASKKYALMLKEELSCDVYRIEDSKQAELKKYDCIIFVGGIYAGGIAGLNHFRKIQKERQNTKAAILCVGASPYDKKAMDEMTKRISTGELRNIPLFYGRGVWDESKMSFKDRTLCGMLKKALSKQDPDTYEPWGKALMEASGQSCDWTDKEYLKPLIAWSRES